MTRHPAGAVWTFLSKIVTWKSFRLYQQNGYRYQNNFFCKTNNNPLGKKWPSHFLNILLFVWNFNKPFGVVFWSHAGRAPSQLQLVFAISWLGVGGRVGGFFFRFWEYSICRWYIPKISLIHQHLLPEKNSLKNTLFSGQKCPHSV